MMKTMVWFTVAALAASIACLPARAQTLTCSFDALKNDLTQALAAAHAATGNAAHRTSAKS